MFIDLREGGKERETRRRGRRRERGEEEGEEEGEGDREGDGEGDGEGEERRQQCDRATSIGCLKYVPPQGIKSGT